MSSSGGRERRIAPEPSYRSGLWAVSMGLVGLMTAFIVVATRWNDPAGVAALGAVASSIAAILTGYFGIQYSQSVGRKRRSR
jgi:hypothetical protein